MTFLLIWMELKMSKNIIFIPNIDCGDGRSTPYHYSVKSYQNWAKQYDDIEVVEWTEPLIDVRKFHVIYQREWVFDILDHNEIDYDQVAVVDSDTIINPKCPNFFEKTNYEYTVVLQNADYEWVGRSIDGWHHHLLSNEIKPKVWEYHNAGFVIVNKKHKEFLDIVKDFYMKNIEKINDIKYYKSYAGADVISTGQTIMNFLVIKHNIKRTFLPERYNFGGLYIKNLLWNPWLNVHAPSWWSDELIFLDMGWIYHFAGIPKLDTEEAVKEHVRRFGYKARDTGYWMKRTYEELYENR